MPTSLLARRRIQGRMRIRSNVQKVGRDITTSFGAQELEALRPVLRRVLEHLDEVVELWYQLYVLHFGDRRSLSHAEFHDIFYNALSRNTKDLLEGEMDRYAINTIRTGELLCERNVPFAEIVASLHLYEESAYTAPQDLVPDLSRSTQLSTS